MPSVIPAPARATDREAAAFEFGATGRIVADETARGVAELLAADVELRIGRRLDIVTDDAGPADLELRIEPFPSASVEAHRLQVSTAGARLTATTAEGLYRGTRTILQLLGTDGTIAATLIEDEPRFAYRGVMLDVARHFFSVDDVTRYIEAIALLKFNHLHLHLTDDQGWRLEIDSRPELTRRGSTTSVGGHGGGHYTHDDYRAIIDFAAARFITVVPEIDVPGHTNAALHSYPELTPDGIAPEPYEGIEVGFSSLDAARPETYAFLEDVIGEVAALTPGPYLHLGGDESLSTPADEYATLIARATSIGAATGKTIIGWHEMGASDALPRGTVGQYWSFTKPQDDSAERTRTFARNGGRVVLSPADVAYLDMRYPGEATGPDGRVLGLEWAEGATSLVDAYGWEPTSIVDGIGEADILGVEAPLWTETARHIDDVTFLAFPRAAAIAEIAWSPRAVRDIDDFTRRLPAFTGLLDERGVRHHAAAAEHRSVS
ncbi:family 20 glycosylhydrolase [Agromyces atrinae]|uniref:beta-N-acetylhexosaminidase n=1 Tax=Agromyces atrinae TaxID=592376 RepID=A0A4Q2M5L5_9MICO|nr:family 20 glycosylhydrolase [Agromyces atrinae]NYD66777.1 hexosaminidase [Agromyces atrinae]RXZ87434.1 beta-N-acetylhexosaminidase [Agromyces atrinae]